MTRLATSAFAQLSGDDPWPKYGHDERNTCFKSLRGPHAPELRWWAPLGTPGAQHPGGAAIAKINGVRYAVVGTPTAVHLDGEPAGFQRPRLYVFRIDDPTYSPGAAAAPTRVVTLDESDFVWSTPIVLPNRWVVVQTRNRLVAYDLSALPNGALPLKWTSEPLHSNRACPTYGRVNRLQTATRVFALGTLTDDPHTPENESLITHVVSIDPIVGQVELDRVFEMRVKLRPSEANGLRIWTCPAIGTLDPLDPYYDLDGVNLVYCSTLGGSATSEDHLFAVFADGIARETLAPGGQGTETSAIAWRTRFDLPGIGNFRIGTYASPAVFPNDSALRDRVIVGADDGALYGLKNRSDVEGASARRWHYEAGDHISETAAITRAGEALFREESNQVRYWLDSDDHAAELAQVNVEKQNHLGAPAADDYRFYIATDGPVIPDQPDPPVPADGRRVHGLCYSLTNSALIRSWGYVPPYNAGTPPQNLRQNFLAPLALNDDGTLIVVNNGYILALRPLRADFDGDGKRNNFDIDAFVLALVDPAAWEVVYGAPYGINLVAIGDCNGDGLVNNFDLDCNIALMMTPFSTPEFYAPCGSGGNGSGDAPGAAGQDDSPPESGENHFWNMVDYLYAYFGMQRP